MRVFLIEDDAMIGRAMEATFKDAGYAVDWVRDGQAAVAAAAAQNYDIVVLDLGLPKKDGLEVLGEIRAKYSQLPLLIVTAQHAVEDRIRGLDGGADDYLPKPFAMAELMARMRAVLRRKGGMATPILSNGRVSLDPATREVYVSGTSAGRLTKRQFALLEALMIRPGAILSRDRLEERVYGWGEEVESNAIEFLIHSLRKRLGTSVIKNVRGVGWMVSRHE